jgi:hypothetical protein
VVLLPAHPVIFPRLTEKSAQSLCQILSARRSHLSSKREIGEARGEGEVDLEEREDASLEALEFLNGGEEDRLWRRSSRSFARSRDNTGRRC